MKARCDLCGGVHDYPEKPSEPRQLVERQATDEGLWFEATTAAEAYLQQALRDLHTAVERDTGGETGPLVNNARLDSLAGPFIANREGIRQLAEERHLRQRVADEITHIVKEVEGGGERP